MVQALSSAPTEEEETEAHSLGNPSRSLKNKSHRNWRQPDPPSSGKTGLSLSTFPAMCQDVGTAKDGEVEATLALG